MLVPGVNVLCFIGVVSYMHSINSELILPKYFVILSGVETNLLD